MTSHTEPEVLDDGVSPLTDDAVDEAFLVGELEGLAEKPESLGAQAWKRFRRHRLAIIGVGLLVFLVAAFWIGPLFSPYTIAETNVLNRNASPSLEHPFGTDPLGRDYFVRAMTGGQFSVRIALLTAVLATVIGLVVGTVGGYFGGLLDGAIGFLVNALLSMPLILILVIFSREYGRNPTTVAILIASLSWLRAARLVRAQTLQMKESEYVLAARAAGAGPVHIIFRHLLPNLIGTLLVEITLLVGTAIILESTLSFLALGPQPPSTTLGTLVAENKGAIDTNPTSVLIPGAIIVSIVLSINFIGDAMRDALDPKSGLE